MGFHGKHHLLDDANFPCRPHPTPSPPPILSFNTNSFMQRMKKIPKTSKINPLTPYWHSTMISYMYVICISRNTSHFIFVEGNPASSLVDKLSSPITPPALPHFFPNSSHVRGRKESPGSAAGADREPATYGRNSVSPHPGCKKKQTLR